MSESYFSENYREARNRFLAAAAAAGAAVRSYPVGSDSGEDLAIDVATLGPDGAPAIVLSSGIHGVEGFLGSAIQLALLEKLSGAPSRMVRYILIHSINPYGFARLRRVNEDNVDLNRNYLPSFSLRPPVSEDYAALNDFLNPKSPPSRLEPFALKAILLIRRMGLQRVRGAIAGGQYAFPQGLFFGGKEACKSTQIVKEHCDTWVGTSRDVLHLDVHSGLGPFGSYKMLLTDRADSEYFAWYAETFGAERVEAPVEAEEASERVAYPVSGLFGRWMQNHFGVSHYRFAAAEFGTHSGIRVLGALRAENRAHHHCAPGDPQVVRAKREILECFCPSAPDWRRRVVCSGLEIIERGSRALLVKRKERFPHPKRKLSE